MARLGLSLIGAFTRSYVAETAAVKGGSIVKAGTDKEQQAKTVTDDNDKLIGVAVDGNAVDCPFLVCEFGGAVPVKAAKAINDTNLDLYMDSTDSTDVKVTDTVPITAGTYWKVGVSKSICSAADEYVLVFVKPEKVVIS